MIDESDITSGILICTGNSDVFYPIEEIRDLHVSTSDDFSSFFMGWHGSVSFVVSATKEPFLCEAHWLHVNANGVLVVAGW